jgi:hypothetical protein
MLVGNLALARPHASIRELTDDILKLILNFFFFVDILSFEDAITWDIEFHQRFIVCLREIDTKHWTPTLSHLFWLFRIEVFPRYLHLIYFGSEAFGSSVGALFDVQPKVITETFKKDLISLTIDGKDDPNLVILQGFGPFPNLKELSLITCRIASRTLQNFLKQHKAHLQSLKISSTTSQVTLFG